jgi:hypothetical protein
MGAKHLVIELKKFYFTLKGKQPKILLKSLPMEVFVFFQKPFKNNLRVGKEEFRRFFFNCFNIFWNHHQRKNPNRYIEE